MSVRTLELNGRTITALEGQTIFAAAWESGVKIPRLCHLGGLSDVGACRLCLVEVEGQKKLQASCLTKVAEDMVVRTDTPRLQAQRKLIIELLLAERNHVCAVCVLNGACELQDLAAELGVDHVRLRPSIRIWRWTSATSALAWIKTAVSSVPAAFACAMKWRARTPGTSPGEAGIPS